MIYCIVMWKNKIKNVIMACLNVPTQYLNVLTSYICTMTNEITLLDNHIYSKYQGNNNITHPLLDLLHDVLCLCILFLSYPGLLPKITFSFYKKIWPFKKKTSMFLVWLSSVLNQSLHCHYNAIVLTELKCVHGDRDEMCSRLWFRIGFWIK